MNQFKKTNQFKTPEEAIAACDAECEDSWKTFTQSHKIDEVQDPIAYGAAKIVFRAGYICGARYVSGFIVKNLQAHSTTEPPKP